ncbi:MAG: hypothetical protein SGJ10_11180 [Bacteroidota bacterium]|nr:hypothetical protein [Bacteroidota bacterium]
MYAGKNNCFNISGIDSLGDSITISGSGIMLDSIYGGQSSYGTFASKIDDSIVSQQFCWTPSCSQISSSPYLLSVELLDKNCNYASKTFLIYVDSLKDNTINATICKGSYYNFNGKQLDSAATYIDTVASGPCNVNSSIIETLNLSVDTPSASYFSANFCPNHDYNFNGKLLTTAGN